MEQLLLHAIGDYWLQTDKQALGKKNKGWYGTKMCFFHCLTYSLPFLLIASWKAVLVIFITHYIIDRTKLVDYMIAIKNSTTRKTGGKCGLEWEYDISNWGFDITRPKFLTLWLYIACDNILHLICNYLAIKYL